MSEAIISAGAVVLVAIIEAFAAHDRKQAKKEREAEAARREAEAEQQKRQEQLTLDFLKQYGNLSFHSGLDARIPS